MDHIDAPPTSSMILYITSDISTTGNVSVADGSFSQTFTVTANAVTFVSIPGSAFLSAGGTFLKGIHITSANNIAVYAHIYASSVSGATLLFPVNSMGKTYLSLNYTQLSNATPSYSIFDVIATQDSTTVSITPSAALVTGQPANVPFTVTLNKGQVFQGLSNTDLTGSAIQSISTSSGSCKKIAVFSGSNKIGIGCSGTVASEGKGTSDNLFQQVYPTSAWGKDYITAPLKNRPYDIYRIVLSKPATNVTLNGTVLTAAQFTGGLYYEFTSTTTNVISADQPIQVVQYTPTQGDGLNCKAVNGDVGDPEMIYLSPIEQGLDHVTLYSTGYYDILASYINVIIPTSATSTFTLDGVPYTTFTPVANNTAYSYAQIPVSSGPQAVKGGTGTVTSGTHTIQASVAFNAIAYGFGSAESYGYAAGTNLQDLNEFVVFKNPVTDTVQTGGCAGVNYNLQVNIPYQTTNISWDFKDGTTPYVDSAPVLIATSVKGTTTIYTYQYPKLVSFPAGNHTVVASVFNPVADECGSTETIEYDFTITNPPVPAFTASTVTCLGSPTVFTDASTVYVGDYEKTWLWDFGDGTKSTLQNPSHIYAAPGNYNVTLTVTGNSGCATTSAPVSIHVTTPATASFTNSAPDCVTQNITFTDRSTSTDGTIVKWVWNFGDGVIDTVTNNQPLTHAYAAAGTDTAKLVVITDKGCSSSPFSQTLTIQPLPVVNFGAPNICVASPQAFTDSTTIAGIGGTPFTYAWNFGDPNTTAGNPNTSTLQNPLHQYTKPAVYTATLTVTSSAGCTFAKTKSFTVYAPPTALFTVPDTTCLGNPTVFADQSVANDGTLSTWLWDFGDGTTNATQDPSHTYAATGNFIVKLTVTNSNGCISSTITKAVHISPLPVASFSYSSPDCATYGITFTDKSTTAETSIISWMWDYGDGITETKTAQTPFQHIYAATGTYTITLTITTAKGCTSSTTQSITINPLPVVDFAIPGICLDDAYAQFTDKSTIPDNTQAAFTYLWNFGDAYSTPANNTSTLMSPKHKYSHQGNYTATLTVTSKYGCVVSKAIQFTVNGATPVAGFNVQNITALCSADSVGFVDKSTVDFGNVTKLVWFFDYTNNPTDSVVYQDATLRTDRIYHHFYGLNNTTNAKTYQVQLFAYSGQTCFNAYMQNIVVNPNPVAILTPGGPVTMCQSDQPLQITTTSNIPGTGVFSGTGVSALGLFDPKISGPGTFTINYLFTATTTGCTFATSLQITVNPTPVVTASNVLTVLEGGLLTLDAKASIVSGTVTYKWTPSTGLSQDDILNPVASPTDNTLYTLTVTSDKFCSATVQTNVEVLKGPIVPNAFTPNGDGINDTWNIKYLDEYPNANITITNRYGTQVYYSHNYPIPWDGRYKGSDLPAGTYYYIINPGSGRKVIAGSVTIIR